MDWIREATARGWSYNLFDGELIVRVEEITSRSTTTTAWVIVTDAHALAAGHHPIVYGRHNLESSRIASQLADEWDGAHGADMRRQKVGSLSEVMKAILTDALIEHREGPDPVALTGQTKPDGDRWLAAPFIERTSHSRLIAAGGSGKSYFGLAIAAAISGGGAYRELLPRTIPTAAGPVMYLDWESDEETHDERLGMLIRGIGCATAPDGVYYRSMRGGGPLHRQTSSIARRIGDLGCVAVIIDSVMLARGSSGEGSAEDSTVRMFEAADELGVPSLMIDHKNKTQVGKASKGGYGSVVMTNSVRNEWDIHQVWQGPNQIRMGMSHTKQNNTSRLPDRFYQLGFADGTVRIEWMDAFMGAGGGEGPTLADAVEMSLIAGPATVTEIAERLGRDAKNVRTVLKRHTARFTELTVTNPTKWCLTADADEYLPDPF